jgi:hypothetical protein
MIDQADKLLTTEEFCELASISVRYAKALRVKGGGPPFVKFGTPVRYRLADVRAWIASRTVSSTSAASPQVAA